MEATTARARAHLERQFGSMERQTHAAQLGMWVFLASEVLFFGALFTLYAAYRFAEPQSFKAAAGETDLLLGSLNTYILVAASFLVALAVGAIRRDRARAAAALLAVAALLGVVFLALKGLEYGHHFAHGIYPGAWYRDPELPERGAKAFFALYYLMTGLHALHVIGGVVVLTWLAVRAGRGAYGPAWHTPLELGGMYWHFVDIVWLFLWPCFYLLR